MRGVPRLAAIAVLCTAAPAAAQTSEPFRVLDSGSEIAQLRNEVADLHQEVRALRARLEALERRTAPPASIGPDRLQPLISQPQQMAPPLR